MLMPMAPRIKSTTATAAIHMMRISRLSSFWSGIARIPVFGVDRIAEVLAGVNCDNYRRSHEREIDAMDTTCARSTSDRVPAGVRDPDASYLDLPIAEPHGLAVRRGEVGHHFLRCRRCPRARFHVPRLLEAKMRTVSRSALAMGLALFGSLAESDYGTAGSYSVQDRAAASYSDRACNIPVQFSCRGCAVTCAASRVAICKAGMNIWRGNAWSCLFPSACSCQTSIWSVPRAKVRQPRKIHPHPKHPQKRS
jgi:hypothetical protein